MKWSYGRDQGGNNLNMADVLENDALVMFRKTSIYFGKGDRN
jgi:hypothetical protein